MVTILHHKVLTALCTANIHSTASAVLTAVSIPSVVTQITASLLLTVDSVPQVLKAVSTSLLLTVVSASLLLTVVSAPLLLTVVSAPLVFTTVPTTSVLTVIYNTPPVFTVITQVLIALHHQYSVYTTTSTRSCLYTTTSTRSCLYTTTNTHQCPQLLHKCLLVALHHQYLLYRTTNTHSCLYNTSATVITQGFTTLPLLTAISTRSPVLTAVSPWPLVHDHLSFTLYLWSGNLGSVAKLSVVLYITACISLSGTNQRIRGWFIARPFEDQQILETDRSPWKHMS